MAVTYFVAQFTHVFRRPRVKYKKQNCLGKNVLKMWFPFMGKKASVSKKLVIEKSSKTKNN